MKRLHTIYSSIVFLAVFAIIFPLFLVLLARKTWKKGSYLLNNAWAWLFFNISSIPYKIQYNFEPDYKKQYIFVANHFSILDIPAMGLVVHQPFKFVGKSSFAKKPFFGFMYRRFHILVNRESLKDRYNSLIKSLKAIDEGYSLVIFPEGGIRSKTPPVLSAFKDGAFRAAIEKKIAIVPVTIGDNWRALPDDGEVLLRRIRNRIIIHSPIETEGFTLDQADMLRDRTFELIQKSLKDMHGDKTINTARSKSAQKVLEKM
jgi:1-acyl-sn-glycerol-3-phosphate acyltransferase